MLHNLFYSDKEISPISARRENSSYWESITRYFIMVIFCIFPFVHDTLQKYANITVTKYNFFRLFTFIYLILLFLMFLGYFLDKTVIADRHSDGIMKFNLAQYFAIAYFVVAAISSILTPYEDSDIWVGNGRFEGLLSVLLYVIVFICLSFWGEYSDYYAYGLSISAFAMGVMGVMQTLGINLMYFEGQGGFFPARFVATLGNVDMVSGFSALVLALIGSFFVVTKSKFSALITLPGYFILFYIHAFVDTDSGKVGLLVTLVALFVIVCVDMERLSRLFYLLSLSSLAYFFVFFLGINEYKIHITFNKKGFLSLWLAFLFLALGFFITKFNIKIKLSNKVLRLIVVAIILFVVVFGLIFIYNYSGSNRLVMDMSSVLHGDFNDDIGSGRGYIWRHGLSTIPEYPFFGSGPDTFIFRFNQFNEGHGNGTQIADFAHNDFIQIAVNYGLIGLVAYLGILVTIAVRAFKVIDKKPKVIIFGCAVLSYLVHSFFSFSIAIVSPYFWVSLGILDKCIRTIPESEVVKSSKKEKK